MINKTFLIIFLLHLNFLLFSNKIINEDLTIKGNKCNISGTLKYIKSDSKQPAVILMHGSGPLDRDGTIQTPTKAVKPYLEFLNSLTKKGFITFAYDKASYSLLKQNKIDEVNNLSVDDFLNDLKISIKHIKSLDIVDSDNIFVVAHSQGAGLIPQIINDLHIKGSILIAPNLLKIDNQVLYQLEYQIQFLKNHNKNNMLDSQIKEIKNISNQLKPVFKNINDYNDDYIILGATKLFWVEWINKTSNQLEQIISINKPVLIINGDMDLKAPVDLIKKNTTKLMKNKNIKLAIIKNMGHEFYNHRTFDLNTKLINECVQWMLKLL